MKKIFVVLLFLLTGLNTKAQVSHSVNIHINEFAEIRLKPTTLEFTDFEFDDVSQLESGITREGAGTYQVRSNEEWIVSVRAKEAFFTNLGEGSSSIMPCSVLKVKEGNSQNDFQALATLPTPLMSGSSGDFGGANEFNLDYQAMPGMDFAPGTYTMNVVLTVTPN